MPAGTVMVSRPPGSECSVTTTGTGASKSPKSSRLGKRKSKWSHKKNKIVWQFYIRIIAPLPTGHMERMHQLWVVKRMRELSF